MLDQRDVMRERCDRKGLSWAKSILPTFPANNENLPYIIEWIEQRESEAARLWEEKQMRLADRSTAAAEVSATAALESAKTSGTSARAAMFAAFVSFLALVVATAAFFKQA